MREKFFLLTGATSGIGADIARSFLSNPDVCVFCTFYNNQKLNKFADENRLGLEAINEQVFCVEERRIYFIRCNLSEESERISMFEFIRSCTNKLDAIINVAGCALFGFFEDVTFKEYKEQFEVNFFAPLQLCKLALPLLKTAKGAKIINVTSGSGRIAFPGMSAYCASKFALEGLTESLYHELSFAGISVTAVEPGAIKTSVFQENRMVAKAITDGRSSYSHFNERLLRAADKKINYNGISPAKVTDAVISILNDPSPPLRLAVGKDVKFMFFLTKILPIPILNYLMRFHLFKG